MVILFYIAAAIGAVAVYFILPQRQAKPSRLGALVGVAALLGLIVAGLAGLAVDRLVGGNFHLAHMIAFAAIAIAAAVRVITHPRPVYSALYFVLVVLASGGMLLLLEAEFMALAMIIIYGGAILVTYMFVIMLATLPQSASQPDTSPVYDRHAREPLLAVTVGFVLVAVVGSAMIGANAREIQRSYPQPVGPAAAAAMPRKMHVDRLNIVLRRYGLVEPGERVIELHDVQLERGVVMVSRGEGMRPRPVELTPQVMGEFVTNIDFVGMDLFRGHVLGIELAGIILLLAMVGAIVIARRPVPESADATGGGDVDIGPTGGPSPEERPTPRV